MAIFCISDTDHFSSCVERSDRCVCACVYVSGRKLSTEGTFDLDI